MSNPNDLKLSIRLDMDESGLVSGARVSDSEVKKMSKGMDAAGQSSRQFSSNIEKSTQSERRLNTETKSLGNQLFSLKNVLITTSAVIGTKFLHEMGSTLVMYEKQKAALETLTGSQEAANDQFKTLENIAATTPFQIEQVVNAYTKLEAFGLNPSQQAMKAYGNTAVAMGKDLDQMIEAVADATTGEFERLKEFGIKSSQEGSKVRFTFRGVTTEIEKSSTKIEEYLQNIGNVEFAGAMEKQMDRLPGVLSNVEDTTASLYRTIGDAGATNTNNVASQINDENKAHQDQIKLLDEKRTRIAKLKETQISAVNATIKAREQEYIASIKASEEKVNQLQLERQVNNQSKATTQTTNEQAKANDQLTKSQQRLPDQLFPEDKSFREYNEQLNQLHKIYAGSDGIIEDTISYQDAIDRLTEKHLGLDKAIADNKNTLDEVGQVYKNAASGIQDSFTEAFENIFIGKGTQSLHDFSNEIKDTFTKTIAELATLAISKPVIVPIVQGIGDFLGVSDQAQNKVLGQFDTHTNNILPGNNIGGTIAPVTDYLSILTGADVFRNASERVRKTSDFKFGLGGLAGGIVGSQAGGFKCHHCS